MNHKLTKRIACVMGMLLLFGCSFQSEPEIKITKFSEEYPEFLKDCPLDDSCMINGGNETEIYYTLMDGNQVQLKQFNYTNKTSSIIYEYEDECSIDTIIEKDGIYYYTEEKRIPMDIDHLESMQNPYVIQYSVKAVNHGESILLASGYYPNYNDSVSLIRLDDSLMVITPDFSYKDGFTEIETYGYKVNFIQGLEIENIVDVQNTWHGYQDSEMFAYNMNAVHTISDQFLLITTNNMQTCFTSFNESGVNKEICLNGDKTDDFILQHVGNTVVYEEMLKNKPYQSNYSLYDLDTEETVKLKAYPKLLYAESINDYTLYALGHNNEDKKNYQKVHYLVQIKDGDLVLHQLEALKEVEPMTSRAIAENKTLLFDPLNGSDVYMIEWY